jgi:hypothetical protein
VIQKDGLTYVSPTGECKRRPETTLLEENMKPLGAERHALYAAALPATKAASF